MRDARVLVVNAGSSSVKLAAFERGAELRRLAVGEIERIASTDGAIDAICTDEAVVIARTLSDVFERIER